MIVKRAYKYRIYPTKRHYGCGYINEDLKLSDREWMCPQCKKAVDRDHNAALNILAAGTAVKSLLKQEAFPFREG